LGRKERGIFVEDDLWGYEVLFGLWVLFLREWGNVWVLFLGKEGNCLLVLFIYGILWVFVSQERYSNLGFISISEIDFVQQSLCIKTKFSTICNYWLSFAGPKNSQQGRLKIRRFLRNFVSVNGVA
jgi:hypothetical protein